MLGLSILEVAERARVRDPAAAALIARMSAAPGEARAGLIDALVRALKAGGIWAKLDLLYCLAAHDAQAARLNWIAAANDLAAVNAPAFTVDRGYAGDGAASYLDTGWTPSLHAVHFAPDYASMGVYLNAGTDTATPVVAMGVNAASSAFLIPRASSDHMRARLNNGAVAIATGTVTTRYGFSVCTRPDASTLAFYRNGAPDSAIAVTSSGLPAFPLFLCGLNNSGTLVSALDNRIAFAFAGAGLSGGEVAALHAAVAAYLIAVGAA